MSNISNAGAWPRRIQSMRFEQNGHIVEVRLDWNHVQGLAQQALNNKTQQATSGPVQVRVVKP